MQVYFTFGQIHTHRVNGKTFDCDSVAMIEAGSENEARNRAFELFGPKWHNSSITIPNMDYYPRGVIPVE